LVDFRVFACRSYIGGIAEGRPGRGADKKKALVAIAVELKGRKTGRARIQIIESASRDNLIEFIQENIEPNSTIVTDGWSGYARLELLGFGHTVKIMSAGKEALPHVHRLASLLKRFLVGTLQGAVDFNQLAYYLDEYTFRYNRRTSSSRGLLFQRLMEQAIQSDPVTWERVREGKNPKPLPYY
jgi:transposase-like protein